jgi:hypothetical protein
MRMSNALDLERGVFTKRSPRAGAIPPGASQRASAPRLIFRLAA